MRADAPSRGEAQSAAAGHRYVKGKRDASLSKDSGEVDTETRINKVE